MRFRVSVIGAGEAAPEALAKAERVGAFVGRRDWVLVTGGLTGVMEAASRGAAQAGGLVVGILPGTDPAEANPHVAVPVVTGVGYTRNAFVVLNGDAVVAVDGRHGTASEMAMARVFGKPVLVLDGPRIEDVPDPIPRAASLAEVERWLEEQEKAWAARGRAQPGKDRPPASPETERKAEQA